jgi:hypothetical protein
VCARPSAEKVSSTRCDKISPFVTVSTQNWSGRKGTKIGPVIPRVTLLDTSRSTITALAYCRKLV